MGSCPHRLHPVPMQNSSTSTDISVMPINLPFLPMVWASSAISPFWMTALKLPILKWLQKRNQIPRMKTSPLEISPVLSDFFSLHPDFPPDTFLGASSFDTIETYGFHFSKTLIPYNSCSTASRNRITYTCKNLNFRMFPSIQRDSDEWCSLYRIRTIVERAIDHLEINICVAGRKFGATQPLKQMFFLPGSQACLSSLLHTACIVHNTSEAWNLWLPEKVSNCYSSFIGLQKYAKNLMIYANSKMILNNDLFFLLI